MNDILKFLNSHASVRKFTDAPITAEQERTIVTTAQRSPTSSNLQTYSIISIRSQETKRQIAELSGNQAHVAACPLFLLFCADLFRSSELTRTRGYNFTGEYAELFIVATVDAALAAGRALQAAQAMGFGGVMVGAIRNDCRKVAELCALPDYVYPVMGMSLGQPAERPKVKPRLPHRAIHFQESYDPRGLDEAIAEYDQVMAELGYLSGRQVEPENYPDFKGDYSWSEHTARRMASTKANTLRPYLLEFLQQRGLLRK